MTPFRLLDWRAFTLLWILLGALPATRLQAQSSKEPTQTALVLITAPLAGAQPAAAPLTLEAVAVDTAGGPIPVVEFLADGVVVARSDLSDRLFAAVIGLKVFHKAVWNAPAPGPHVLVARGYRDQTPVAQSEAVSVTIGSPLIPVEPPVIPIIDPPVSTVELTALDPMAVESDPKDLMTFEFRRTGDLSKPLRVYFKIGGSADWNTDFEVVPGGLKPEPVDDAHLAPWVRSVVIPAGSPVGKLPLVPIPDDKVEGDELLYLAVIPKPAGVSAGAEPCDYQTGANSAARVMIRDSIQTPPTDAPTVRIRTVQSATAEPNPRIRVIPGRLVFQRLGNPAEPLRVRYAVGGSARNGEDYSLLDGDLTLGAGETEIELIIGALEDGLKEPEETVVIKLLDDPSYRIDPSGAWAQVTIADSTESTTAFLNWMAPTVGERLRIGTECSLKVIAVDPNSYIPAVSFWANGKPIGDSRIQFFRAPDPGTPIEHTLTWKPDAEGPIRLEATAVDASGSKLVSTAVLILGVPETRPVDRDLHPTDNAPADSVISDMEWMLASKYWRYGIPLPPQTAPLPLGHLTRAGFLWRSGGAYRYEASVGSLPMAWIPLEDTTGNATHSGLLAPLSGWIGVLGTNGTPERSPTSYLLGELTPGTNQTMALKIHLGPAPNTRCHGVEVFVGRSAAVTAISDEGQFDPKSGIVRWGPFLDDAIRGLNATVSGASALEFRGLGSFDGDDRTMMSLGLKSVSDGPATSVPRLAAMTASSQGDARMVLIGANPGSALDLEVSEDMIQWRRIGTVFGTGESQLQVDTDAGTSPRRFYRVIPRNP